MTTPITQDGARLIAALREPRCYPHSVTNIEVRETHISWVLLTGEYAYKLKKPVKLTFLDFSTLALRKHFCEEELRLNRRLAPDLYLEVVAITGTKNQPTIAGTGQPIDYALKLKQFPASEELTALLEARQVDCADLGEFGDAFANIQAALPETEASPEAWRSTVELNMADLRQLLSDQIDRIAAIEATHKLQSQQLLSLLDARYQTSAVRECHGDLHLGNVVRLPDGLTPFDCIEFDAALRNIDVLNDVAFLYMDLIAHKRRDLAYCFLNTWLANSGDYAALPLLPHYAMHRALVRAKVAALRSPQDQHVEIYLQAAEHFCEPTTPFLIITCGLSGSGKTWLSKRLAPVLPAIHIRSDVERKRLAGLSALASSRSAPDAGIYTKEFNARTYEHLLAIARASLTAGDATIVDAAFLRRSERLQFAALAKECRCGFIILHCEAPNRTLQTRIQQRTVAANDASEATVTVLEKQHGYWEAFGDEETAHVLNVNTNLEFDSLSIADIAARIASKRSIELTTTR
jgi:aminoglycoside phosphotransferase family enzyme/predicted kinase